MNIYCLCIGKKRYEKKLVTNTMPDNPMAFSLSLKLLCPDPAGLITEQCCVFFQSVVRRHRQIFQTISVVR